MTDYGRDTLCLDSQRTGRYARGIRLVDQRCYHRLITPRGTLHGGPDEGNFGLDLAGMCGAAVTPELEAAIGPRIDNELRKDPQVETTKTIVESSTVRGQTSWTITIEIDSAYGPFELVLGVSGVTVELLNLEVRAA